MLFVLTLAASGCGKGGIYMAKYYLIADVTAYVEVEAENEDDAWEKGKLLPLSAWDIDEHVGDIWSITEE